MRVRPVRAPCVLPARVRCACVSEVRACVAWERCVVRVMCATLGGGPSPQPGQTVVVEWVGYTEGYQAKKIESTRETDKPFTFVVGRGEAIPAFEEAVLAMKQGGIRRIEIPGELEVRLRVFMGSWHHLTCGYQRLPTLKSPFLRSTSATNVHFSDVSSDSGALSFIHQEILYRYATCQEIHCLDRASDQSWGCGLERNPSAFGTRSILNVEIDQTCGAPDLCGAPDVRGVRLLLYTPCRTSC
jgi:hypothetical protein